MRTYLECIPCLLKHGLRSANVAGASKKKQRDIVNELGQMIQSLPLSSSPPEIARMVNNVISRISGKNDIYKKIKQNSNVRALEMYAALKKKITLAHDPLLEAVECAIAGNVIDYGVHDTEWIEQELKRILTNEKKGLQRQSRALFKYKKFKQTLSTARTILYLGDNAGETVFDRLLIETILEHSRTKKEVTFVVKEKPAINDALVADAYACGLHTVASVISSGSDAPGTVLSLCTNTFKKKFREADMIISKGQGNFEALSHVRREMFFLLMIKCPVIAQDVSNAVAACSVGDTVLLHHQK